MAMVRIDKRRTAIFDYIAAGCSFFGLVVLVLFFLWIVFFPGHASSMGMGPTSIRQLIETSREFFPAVIVIGIVFLPIYYVLLRSKKIYADKSEKKVLIDSEEHDFGNVDVSREYRYFGLGFSLMRVRVKSTSKRYWFITKGFPSLFPFGVLDHRNEVLRELQKV